MPVQPIDKQRVGRVVLAILDGDSDKAAAIIDEAVAEDRLHEYAEAILGAFLGFMRLAVGVDGIRQWASDWILHARLEDGESN